MLFRQILNDDLGCASYVIACGGSAAVVDPQWDIAPYLELAAAERLRITDVLLTHNHADHISGHGRLQQATGARIHVSAEAGARYPHEPLTAGDEVQVGKVMLRAAATAGHRPEHLSFLLIDQARSDDPWALLAGDFILVGDLARPDLAVEPRDGAAAIHEALRQFDDNAEHLEVWPGHTGGSLCGGAGMSRKPSSTIGYERATNPLLTTADKEAFIDELTSGLAPQPPNFQRIAEFNQGPLITQAPEPRALTAARVAELIDEGAVVIDVRDPREFDAEHIPGSLNATSAAAGVGTRAAWFTPPDSVVVVAAGSDDGARAALSKLQAAGLLNTAGFLAGGIGSWRADDRTIASTVALDPPALARQLAAESTILVDVRDRDEWLSGHVAGSIHAPFHELRDCIPAAISEASNGQCIAVACSAGNRSTLATSLLRRRGIDNVQHVTDGGVPDLAELDVTLSTGA